MSDTKNTVSDELLPCPFCGDRMERHFDVIRHVDQGRCVIGANAWPDSRADHWNLRAYLAASPAHVNETPETEQVEGYWSDDKTYEEAPASAQSALAAMRAERDHWKANHAEMVPRNAVLRERPDLPADRLPSIARYEARIKALEEALTANADTKADYIGEFQFSIAVPGVDEDDEPCDYERTVTVPWSTIKKIMAAIRSRSALKENAL